MTVEKHSPGGTIKDVGSSISNKTGSWRTFRPVVDVDKCTGCGTCERFCPDGSIVINKTTRKAEIDYDYCKGCMICAEVCPMKCISKEVEDK